MFVAASHSAGMGFQGTTTGYSVGSSISGSESTGPWVAIYTKQHHEKRVAEYRADQAFDCYLPLYTSERKWSNHRTATIHLPLFPTYLFVRTSPRVRIRILRTPGVIGIVSRGSIDESISDHEIEILRGGLHLRHPEPHTFAVGARVRIAAGHLQGFRESLSTVVVFSGGDHGSHDSAECICRSRSRRTGALCPLSACRPCKCLITIENPRSPREPASAYSAQAATLTLGMRLP